MSRKNTAVAYLLLIAMLLCLLFPLLVSCSSAGQTDDPARESSTATVQKNGTTTVPEPTSDCYIGNASTGVFHRPDCNRIPLMNPANKVMLRGTRDHAIARGYTPCGICRP